MVFSTVKSQPVKLFFGGDPLKIPTIKPQYEAQFGAGNVTLTNMNINDTTAFSALNDFTPYDIVIFHDIVNLIFKFKIAHCNALVSYINQGGHVVLSLEGNKNIPNQEHTMQYIWNTLTGQSIGQTEMGQAGTQNPPRFHPSNGPWGLSPTPNLVFSTQSYASFDNVPAVNVVHQRLSTPSVCTIEGVNIVYPSHPKIGDGTLYMTGEWAYPFANTTDPNLVGHIDALVKMHKVLLTKNQTTLDQINAWSPASNSTPGQVNLGSDIYSCSGASSQTITASTALTQTYLWNTGETSNSIDVTVSGKYWVNVTSSSGCKSSDTINVQLGLLDVTFSTTDVTCSNGSSLGSITATVTAGKAPYLYDFNDTGGSSTYIFTDLFADTYSLVVSGADGCQVDTSFTITSPALPELNVLSTQDVLCFGSCDGMAELTVSSGTQPFNFNWGLSTSADSSRSDLCKGTYIVTVVDVNGCSDTTLVLINEPTAPSLSLTWDTVCFGDSTHFFAAVSFNGGGTPDKWVWDFENNATLLFGNQNVSFLYKYAGNHTVNFLGISSNNCGIDTTVSVIVNPRPAVDFNFTPTCLSDSTQFTNNSQITNGTLTHLWDFGDNTTDNIENPSHLYNSEKNFTIKLTGTSDKGCIDSSSKSISISPLPVLDFSSSDTQGCTPLCVSLIPSIYLSYGAINDYVWDYGNGHKNTDSLSSYCYKESGKFPIELTAITDKGCKKSLRKADYITVFQTPNAHFDIDSDSDEKFVTNNPLKFSNLSSDEVFVWNWSFGDSSLSDLSSPIHSYSDSGFYTVVLAVKTENNCTDTTTKIIKINPAIYLYLPNTFTPDDNDINDLFIPKSYGISISNYTFQIIDRWGSIVFETHDLSEGWNGASAKHNTDFMKNGVYVYRLEFEDLFKKKYNRIGSVTLLK